MTRNGVGLFLLGGVTALLIAVAVLYATDSKITSDDESGSATVEVPSVIGLERAEAQAKIESKPASGHTGDFSHLQCCRIG